MVGLIRELLAHAEWANFSFFETWGQSPARDHEELRRRASHIIGVQEGFLSVLRGLPPGGPPGGPPASFEVVKARAVACHAALHEFVANLDANALAQTVQIPWFPDPPCVITTGEALVQVAMHSQHHRGQCMTRLKDFGGTPVNVDFIIWLWQRKPQARWAEV